MNNEITNARSKGIQGVNQFYKGIDADVEAFELHPYYLINFFTRIYTHGYHIMYQGSESKAGLKSKSSLDLSNNSQDQNGFALKIVVSQFETIMRSQRGTVFDVTEALGLITAFFAFMILPISYIKSLFNKNYYNERTEIAMEEIKNDSVLSQENKAVST